MTRPPCAIVVDGVSTGRYFAPEFRRLGLDVVHVTDCAAAVCNLAATLDRGPFTAVYPYHNEVDALVETLISEWRPIAIVAGTDMGVRLADRLAAELGLRGNPSATSARRMHKFEMVQAAASNGVITADQLLTGDVNAALKWASTKRDWPIVAKPVASSGSEDVVYCSDKRQIEAMFERILGKQNIYGSLNKDVLLQTFLDGPQYVVNAVSRDGRHLPTDVWSIEQRQVTGGSHITDHKWSLSPDDPLTSTLVEAAKRTLDACDVLNGPSHTELRITQRGPALIETSARLMGATLEPELFIRAFGTSQARLSVESAINGAAFDAAFERGYSVHEHMAIFHLNIPKSGKIAGVQGSSEITRLRSFQAMIGLPKAGAQLKATSVNIARAGYIYLLHENKEQLLADVARVRDICAADRLFTMHGPDQAKSDFHPRTRFTPMTSAA